MKSVYTGLNYKGCMVTEMQFYDVWYEFDEWEKGFDVYNESADVHFSLSDGSRWCASFYTYEKLSSLAHKNADSGECLGGRYFYADKPVFIEKLDKELILAVLRDIIYKYGNGVCDLSEVLSEVFTRVDEK